MTERAGSAAHLDGSSALVITAIALLGAAICIVRVPWQLHDVAWAEDANVFLEQGLKADPWTILGAGYAGYLHFVPRFVAAVTMSTVSAESYAVVIFFVCAVLAGLVCAAVFVLAAEVVPWAPARVVLAMLPVLLPLSAQEVLGNLANLHTLAFWLVLWILFAHVRTRWAAVGWALVVFVCGATEIQTIILLGLAPFFLRRGDPLRWPPYIALLLAGVWQAATFLSTPRTPAEYVLAPLSYPYGWLINALLPMANADPGSAGRWLDSSGILIPVLILIPFTAAATIALVWGSNRQRLLVATTLVLSVTLYAASAWVNASPGLDYAATDGLLSGRFLHMRYGVSAGLLLATSVPVAAAALRVHVGARGLRRVASIASIAALTIVFSVAGTRSFPARSLVEGPWSAGARQANAICATSGPDQEVVLPVAPQRVLVIDCAAWASYPRR